MNTILKFSDEGLKSAQLMIMIRATATQKAAADIMIEMFSLSQNEADRFQKRFAEKIEKYTGLITDDLYREAGAIDIKDILK